MTDLLEPETAEKIVGVPRDLHVHFGRIQTGTSQFTILHSAECRDSGIDLRECPFSLALDAGLRGADWPSSTWSIPLALGVADGRLVPVNAAPAPRARETILALKDEVAALQDEVASLRARLGDPGGDREARALVLARIFDDMGQSVIDEWVAHDGAPAGRFTTDDLRALAATQPTPTPETPDVVERLRLAIMAEAERLYPDSPTDSTARLNRIFGQREGYVASRLTTLPPSLRDAVARECLEHDSGRGKCVCPLCKIARAHGIETQQ